MKHILNMNENFQSRYIILTKDYIPILDENKKMKIFTGEESRNYTDGKENKYIVLCVNNNMLNSYYFS